MKEIVLVTGGSKGIGKATCQELSRKGYHILINYNQSETQANLVKDDIINNGGSAEILKFDVTNFSETKDIINDWCNKNENFITALVNNAGITRDNVFPFISRVDWNEVIATSLTGFYNVTQSVLPSMLRNRYGNIVNVSSTAGLAGAQGQTNYSAAKAGLIGATKSLALEVAKRKIRVNAVAPGFIETEMTSNLDKEKLTKVIPMNRFGLAEEVAKVISFLLSDDSSYITGETLSVNGGLYT